MGSEGGLKGMLRKAAALVVEMPPEPVQEFHANVTPEQRAAALEELRRPKPGLAPPTKTIQQIVREQPGPNLEDIGMHPAAAQAVTVSQDGQVDFGAVYSAAQVPPAGFTAEQVLDMISQLPAELPLEAKRQMAKVSISAMGKALGVTPETVVADASRKLAAIAAYEEQQQALTTELLAKSNEAIAELEAKIAERKRAVTAAQARAQQITEQCKTQADRLDDILEFFSQDVAPSRNAPPAN